MGADVGYTVNLVIIRFASLVWLYGAILHWLIIFGVFYEDAPRPVLWFFHACAVMNFFIAYGLWNLLGWARIWGISVASVHLFIHGYLLYRQFADKRSIEKFRYTEIAMALFQIIYFNHALIKGMFK